MKIIHLSDLHLGKRVNEFSMLEDQEYILTKIINIIDEEKPQAVLIAGDVYDKSLPSTEAVNLLDDFLWKLAKRNLAVLIISGNHDSPERLSFGNRLLDKSRVYVAPPFDGEVRPVTLTDEHGDLRLFLLPFVKPVHVRSVWPEQTVETYTDALRVAIANMGVDPKERNILVTHQFVTGASRSESEEVTVGGSDNVDASVFAPFDYVALGHIHGPQRIERDSVRYCGTPLKYSFSERDHVKSVTVVHLGPKGDVRIHTVPLVPKHDMRHIKGLYNELTLRANYLGTATDDYLHITLHDEEDVPDAVGRLRAIYPNLMKLDYDNARTRSGARLPQLANPERQSELELFAEFYRLQNGQDLTVEQKEFVEQLLEASKEEAR